MKKRPDIQALKKREELKIKSENSKFEKDINNYLKRKKKDDAVRFAIDYINKGGNIQQKSPALLELIRYCYKKQEHDELLFFTEQYLKGISYNLNSDHNIKNVIEKYCQFCFKQQEYERLNVLLSRCRSLSSDIESNIKNFIYDLFEKGIKEAFYTKRMEEAVEYTIVYIQKINYIKEKSQALINLIQYCHKNERFIEAIIFAERYLKSIKYSLPGNRESDDNLFALRYCDSCFKTASFESLKKFLGKEEFFSSEIRQSIHEYLNSSFEEHIKMLFTKNKKDEAISFATNYINHIGYITRGSNALINIIFYECRENKDLDKIILFGKKYLEDINYKLEKDYDHKIFMEYFSSCMERKKITELQNLLTHCQNIPTNIEDNIKQFLVTHYYKFACENENKGVYNIAKQSLQKAYEINEHDPNVLHKLSWYDQLERKFDSAESKLLEAKELLPNDKFITENLCILYYRQGKHEQVIKYAQQSGQSLVINTIQAFSYYYLNNTKEFNKHYELTMQISAETAYEYYYKSLLYNYKSEAEKADECLKEGLDKFPDSSELLLLKAEYLLSSKKEGDFREAIQLCKQILKKSPEDFEALTIKGLALWNIGRYFKAFGIFKELQKKARPGSIIEYYLGYGYTTIEVNYEEAEHHLSSIINSQTPLHTNIISRTYKTLAKIYLGREDYDQAIRCYNKLIVHDPMLASPYIKLGDIYLNKTINRTEAIGYLKEAVALKPSYLDKYKNLYLQAGIINSSTREENKSTIAPEIELEKVEVALNLPIKDDQSKGKEKSKQELRPNSTDSLQQGIKSDKFKMLQPLPRTHVEIGLGWGEQYPTPKDERVFKIAYGSEKDKSKTYGYLSEHVKQQLEPLVIEKIESVIREGRCARAQGQSGFKFISTCKSAGVKEKIAEIKIKGQNGIGDMRVWGERVKNDSGEELYVFDKIGKHK